MSKPLDHSGLSQEKRLEQDRSSGAGLLAKDELPNLVTDLTNCSELFVFAKASTEQNFKYAFTVFTPTFNRARTLPRVYESLKRQTLRDFEWLIVDDGSTDETRRIVEAWQQEAVLRIRYLFQANRGKHFAINRGVREAEGKFFLTLDSDDECVPEALARLNYHWESIPDDMKHHFSAVTALCVDQHGRIVGDRFPRDVLDSNSSEIRYRHKVEGEKWGFQRTQVLREHPFPEDISRSYVPEGVVWMKIAEHYQTRYVNEALRIYWIDEPSMTHGQNPGRNAAGAVLLHMMTLNSELKYFRSAPLAFLASAIHYSRFSFHDRRGLITQYRRLRSAFARVLWTAMLPAGLLAYLRDRVR